ncbi:hypothetical protein NPIL_547751 [Nephila pilipes]|uniref:Uncharacterized protein n=1 Tax=Nephila pilipes TaxID=299642 RepID=A0A8X6PQS5_NEPPI|nr:hypothetical protein NPIL_547751 [Nephila pilipes]
MGEINNLPCLLQSLLFPLMLMVLVDGLSIPQALQWRRRCSDCSDESDSSEIDKPRRTRPDRTDIDRSDSDRSQRDKYDSDRSRRIRIRPHRHRPRECIFVCHGKKEKGEDKESESKVEKCPSLPDKRRKSPSSSKRERVEQQQKLRTLIKRKPSNTGLASAC